MSPTPPNNSLQPTVLPPLRYGKTSAELGCYTETMQTIKRSAFVIVLKTCSAIMLKRSLTLLVLLCLAGCDFRATGGSETEEDLALQTDQSTYSVGEVPEVMLESGASQSVFLPSCGGRMLVGVQKREGDSWEDHYATICQALYTVVFETEVESGERWETQKIEEAGTYRIRQRVKQGSDDPQVLYSNEFEVE